MTALQLLRQPGKNKRVCSSCGSSSLSSSFPAHALLTLGSVNSVNSEAVGVVGRIRSR